MHLEAPSPPRCLFLRLPACFFFQESAACALCPAWEEAQEEGGGVRGQCPLTTQQQAQRGKAQVKSLPEERDRVSCSTQPVSQGPMEVCARSRGKGKGKGTSVS